MTPKLMHLVELFSAICSILVLGFACPPEEVVDDIVDRFARGEMSAMMEFLKGD